MRPRGVWQLLAVGVLSLALFGLAGCGPNEPEEESGESAASGAEDFVPNAPVPGEQEMESASDAVDAEETTALDPVTEMSHEPENAGEDLYQRGFYEEAMEQWRADADAGDAYAAYRLGVEYFDGQVVERDLERAAHYQRLAADLGYPAAMFELAAFYEQGQGVNQNMQEAAAWYLEAARRGFPPAQHNIATMFEEGTAVEQDLVQAYLYYSLAIEQGFRVNFVRDEETGEGVFVDPREHLLDIMTPEQIRRAEQELRDFTPIE